jgi:hypothetical protein
MRQQKKQQGMAVAACFLGALRDHSRILGSEAFNRKVREEVQGRPQRSRKEK